MPKQKPVRSRRRVVAVPKPADSPRQALAIAQALAALAAARQPPPSSPLPPGATALMRSKPGVAPPIGVAPPSSPAGGGLLNVGDPRRPELFGPR